MCALVCSCWSSITCTHQASSWCRSLVNVTSALPDSGRRPASLVFNLGSDPCTPPFYAHVLTARSPPNPVLPPPWPPHPHPLARASRASPQRLQEEERATRAEALEKRRAELLELRAECERETKAAVARVRDELKVGRHDPNNSSVM